MRRLLEMFCLLVPMVSYGQNRTLPEEIEVLTLHTVNILEKGSLMMYLRSEDLEAANQDIRDFILRTLPQPGEPAKY